MIDEKLDQLVAALPPSAPEIPLQEHRVNSQLSLVLGGLSLLLDGSSHWQALHVACVAQGNSNESAKSCRDNVGNDSEKTDEIRKTEDRQTKAEYDEGGGIGCVRFRIHFESEDFEASGLWEPMDKPMEKGYDEVEEHGVDDLEVDERNDFVDAWLVKEMTDEKLDVRINAKHEKQEDDEKEEELDVSEAKAAEDWEARFDTALAKNAAEIAAARNTQEQIAATLASMATSRSQMEAVT